MFTLLTVASAAPTMAPLLSNSIVISDSIGFSLRLATLLPPRNVPDSAVLWRSLALLATRQPVHNGRRLSVQLKAEKARKMGKSLAVIRILVVDDYQPFMRFVRATLQERPELQVIAEAADGSQAVQKAAALKPDLILLDI